MQPKKQMIIKQSNKQRYCLRIADTGIFQFKQNDPKHSKKVSSYSKTLSLKTVKTQILGNGRYKFIVRIIDDQNHFEAIVESKEDLQRLFKLLGNRCIVLGLQQSVASFKKIGEGSFAQVYQAITNFHSKYALKCFEKKGLYDNQKTKKAYLNQIEIMKRLNSPYIVSFDYLFQTQKAYYLKMEYFQKTLKQKIAGKLLINSQKTYLKQLLMGLVELKAKGIIHRDLKPDNIMIRKKQNGHQQCVIIDMGLSTLVDSVPYLYVRCGTPGFLSPQIANLTNKKQKQPCASDMFSLGCIFYKMITGRYLFSGATAKQVLQRNRKCEYSTNFDSLSLKQRDLLTKMIDQNPTTRITPQQALKHSYFDQDIDDCDEVAQQQCLISKNLKRIACSYPIKNMESVYNSFQSLNEHSISSAIYRGKRPTLKDSCLTFQLGSHANSIAEDFLARKQSLISPKSLKTPEKGFRQSRFSKMCVL